VEGDADAELMLRVAAGDKAAFAQIFDRYQASVARFAFRFVGTRARAEELAQEIFIKLYRNAKSYRRSAKFKTFLFRVATNHCLNEVRRGEYRVPHATESDGPTLEGLAEENAGPEKALQGKELEDAVSIALSQLSERERAAFAMCRFEGMAYREIAIALSASEAAVKSLIHRATLSLAKSIQELQGSAVPIRSRA
jgi:RNA polymerase sigma-70 factor (ECF subfamily)